MEEHFISMFQNKVDSSEQFSLNCNLSSEIILKYLRLADICFLHVYNRIHELSLTVTVINSLVLLFGILL